MLTKKDFKAVAEIIDDIRPIFSQSTREDMGRTRACTRIAKSLADYFATQNLQFDRERFMQACGLTE